MSQTIDKPRIAGPGQGFGDQCRVIVLNDDHNTFDGVAALLSTYIPGVSYDGGMKLAMQIHNSGKAVVWRGNREPAELYWEQLHGAGLTMAPLG